MQPPMTTITDWGLPTPLSAYSNRLAEFTLWLGQQGWVRRARDRWTPARQTSTVGGQGGPRAALEFRGPESPHFSLLPLQIRQKSEKSHAERSGWLCGVAGPQGLKEMPMFLLNTGFLAGAGNPVEI